MERIRNVGIMTHIDVGKTATTEHVPYYTGVNYKIGDTHEGTTTMDWMAQEQERGTTITSAVVTYHWTLRENCKLKPGMLEHRTNITDTPGHINFIVEVERSLRVLGGVAGAFCTKGDVELQSESVWRQADTHNAPRTAFTNRMDILGANFYGAVNQVRTRLGENAVCIQPPVGKEDDFKGIVDLFEMKAYTYGDGKSGDISIIDIPEDMKDDAELYRSKLVEKTYELDGDLMMAHLESEESGNDNLKKALRKATCEHAAISVRCGTAYRNRGIQKLLDAVIEFISSLLDIPSIEGTDLDGDKVERHSSNDGPFAALAFRTMADPFIGKLALFRVYLGSLNSGSYALNVIEDKEERVGRILQMHANRRGELDKAYSGDITAAVGLEATPTGDTICDEENPVILESTELPELVIDIAIKLRTRTSQDKMGDVPVKLTEEDPTFRVRADEEIGQTIISDVGELHLDIIVDRLLRESNIETNVGASQAAYKETFTKVASVGNKYAKQSGGHGQYGYRKVHLTPMEADAEETFKFTSPAMGGAVPKEYIPAVGEGIEEACKTGILGGFPVLGAHAGVYDGPYYEADSSEVIFHTAGSMALKEAMQKDSLIPLEPIMKVEAAMSEEYMGDVIGGISSRRGRIEGMEDIGDDKMVKTYASLSEMFGYSTSLRSRTQGRGNYPILPGKYEPVPRNV